MKVAVLLVLVVFIAALGGTVFLGYMGFFATPGVEEKDVGPYVIVYEEYTGDYSKVGEIYNKIYRSLKEEGIETTLGIGIYYDDPRMKPKSELRSDCGVILETGDQNRIAELMSRYKVKEIPRASAVVAEFPVKNKLSYMIGPMKAYPALIKYMNDKGLGMEPPPYEIYDMHKARTLYIMNISREEEE